MFQGLPASGRSIRVEGIIIEHYCDGRVAERWDQFDLMGMLQQIGALPVPQA